MSVRVRPILALNERVNMSSLNKKRADTGVQTHEGGQAERLSPEQQLRRTVMACLLWEKQFYEDGQSIADRIKELVPKIGHEKCVAITSEARNKMHLRHVPLLLAREMARQGWNVQHTLLDIIQRPDELCEFLAIYWADGRCPVAASVKRGLADAFKKFNAYSLAKYNRDRDIKLRDVMFICHPKPNDEEQAATWKKLAENELESPDTWEVNLSGGADKRKTFERLIKDGKLGGLAMLRNIRNMEQAGVAESVIRYGISSANMSRVLPFRFITAAKHGPHYEDALEESMMKSLSQQKKLSGKTVFIVDVSGSMYNAPLSVKSELTRADVACSMAMIVRGLTETSRIYATAGSDRSEIHATKEVPPRHGFALRDAIYAMCRPLGGGGIFLKQVMDYVWEQEKKADRIIVITDEQDCDHDPKRSALHCRMWGKQHYLINVASAANGIGYGAWTHIDGWSESVVDYIMEAEKAS